MSLIKMRVSTVDQSSTVEVDAFVALLVALKYHLDKYFENKS